MIEEISGRKPSYGFFSRLTYGIGEIFEKVTGFAYDKLWSRANAGVKSI